MSGGLHTGRSTTAVSWDKCVQFELPSSRNFVKTHPHSYIANLHSDTTKIGPTWTKVTTTPWDGRAKLCGGYGRRLCNTSISNDAPESFINPEVVPIPANRIDDAAAFVIGRRVPPHQEPFAVSQILPGGQGIKDATLAATTAPSSPYRTYPYGKQTLLDNSQPGEFGMKKSPFKWDHTPRVQATNASPSMTMIVSARDTARQVMTNRSGASQRSSEEASRTRR